MARPAVARVVRARNVRLFMAGGGGSGKTTAVTNVAASLLDRAHLVYDTTLSRYEPAEEKVQASPQAALHGAGVAPGGG